jgi:cyclic pyranopterin phosphate synthase
VSDEFSHLAEDGSVRMVDVSAKPVSKRVATAEAMIALRPETMAKIDSNQVIKGFVIHFRSTTCRLSSTIVKKESGSSAE